MLAMPTGHICATMMAPAAPQLAARLNPRARTAVGNIWGLYQSVVLANRGFVRLPYLGAINPGGRAKAYAEPQRVDENKHNTSVVRRSVYVVGVSQGQCSVDLGLSMNEHEA